MAREDACFLMVQVRHLIEGSETPDNYRVAEFYATWTVHTELDRSIVCLEILRDITCVLAANFNPTSPDLTSQISQVIGFPRLRSELVKLFIENKLPLVIFEHWENWKNFVGFLIWHVIGQPIGFPERLTGRAKTIHAEMMALPRPSNIAVDKLMIIAHADTPHWFLQLSGDKTVNMMGLLDIGSADRTA